MAAPNPTREELMEAFYNFDEDKDGYISVEDMNVVMMTKGAKMSREESAAFCQEIDFHHNGQINYAEAINYLLACLAQE